MRKFVIGDIHNSYKALLQVFEKSNFDFKNDKAIFLGDFLDGWSESKETLDFVMSIPNKEVIRGNHDEWALSYYTGKSHYLTGVDYTSWKAHGGYETIKSLGNIGEIDQKYIDFLESTKYYHEEDDKLFVHAGYSLLTDEKDNLIHPSKQHPYNLCWDRQLIESVYSYRTNNKIKIQTLWTEVYVGHTPTISFDQTLLKPQKWQHVWNIDTGSAFTGNLSMMNIDTKELFQSDLCMKLYPDEKGRNKKSWNEIK